jgi:hypothetical protein
MVGHPVFAANIRSETTWTRNLITLILIVLEARADYGFYSSVAINSNVLYSRISVFADVWFMTIPMGSFYKTENCPPSDKLLNFQNGKVQLDACGDILDHLGECEFCAAEVEFYRVHPPLEETVVAGKMPPPLFELANALLQKERDLTPLYSLIGEAD